MAGGGQQRKREAFLSALLAQPTVKQAATVAGISAATATRWLADKAFQEQYAAARRRTLDETVAFLQSSMLGAVAVLRSKMLAADSPPWLQVQCARDLLTLGLRSWELFETEARLKRLEEMVQRYEATG